LPKICVSIAAENLEQLENDLSEAQNSAADFLEIRFDFLRSSDFDEALRLADRIKSKSVYTLRDESELGKFRGNNEERTFWLTRLANAGPMLLDIEFNILRINDELMSHFKKNNTSILISWHNGKQTPNLDELRALMSKMKQMSKYIKIVTMAESIEDAISVLELYRDANDSNLIAFAMGEKGILSRVLCALYKTAPFTYASLGSEVAPGQLSIYQMRRLYYGMFMKNGIGEIH
jgi:3-dehydroquinate dehydratase I